MVRYCFAVDLKDDPIAIAAYEEYHKSVWPEIIQSIKDAGIHAVSYTHLTLPTNREV